MHALDSTDRLHLLMAVLCLLSGTTWGLAAASIAAVVVVTRRLARHLLAPHPAAPGVSAAWRGEPTAYGPVADQVDRAVDCRH